MSYGESESSTLHEDGGREESRGGGGGGGGEDKEMCRDFKKGDCRRGQRCIYYHPKLDVCRDFQFRDCSRRGCKFVHISKSDLVTFDGTGKLPAHVTNGPFPPQQQHSNGSSFNNNNNNNSGGLLGKRDYNAMSSSSRGGGGGMDVCRDFEKGDCRRRERCKFAHPKLVVCRDFQKEKCDRPECRFLHMTREEEETFDGNGIVPDHIDRKKLERNKKMPEASDTQRGGDRGRGGDGGGDDTYGKRPAPYPGTTIADIFGGFKTGSRSSLEVILAENASLKIKLVEMQDQITDLRKMNDTLYEQNNNYRNAAAGGPMGSWPNGNNR